MTRKPATRLHVSGHNFLLRRMQLALLCRDSGMHHDPLRAQSRSLISGCVLAAVAAVVGLVAGFVRPRDALGDDPVVMVRGTGALYVRVDDTLHPVLNLASARLIAGTAAKPRPIRASELKRLKRGVLLGIPGAPSVITEPLTVDESGWAVCDSPATTPDAKSVTTTVMAGVAAEPAGATALVKAARGSTAATYLLYDGHRASVDLGDIAVVRALRLEGVVPQVVSAGLLNLIPELPPIAAPVVPGAGTAGPPSMAGFPVGSVVQVIRADAVEHYVVLTNGIQRVGRVAADLIRFAGSRTGPAIVAVAPDVVSAAPAVDTLAVATFPADTTTAQAGQVVCAQWSPGTVAGPRVSIRVGGSLPLTPRQVPLARGGTDAVFVPPGRSVYARSTGIDGDTTGPGSLYLVTDTGVCFGIPDSATAERLGLSAAPVPAPWSVLKLLAAGPELSRDNALVTHDGVVALPGGPGVAPSR